MNKKTKNKTKSSNQNFSFVAMRRSLIVFASWLEIVCFVVDDDDRKSLENEKKQQRESKSHPSQIETKIAFYFLINDSSLLVSSFCLFRFVSFCFVSL